ncbi:MAG: hypothetical protein IKK46_02055 [Clostridia bacterium]|nr:hypothetical protein [Clostridia bacterium]
MAALVCDLCGGKLVMGAGGIASCDSCGMEHSANRMKEKVQEIKGTVMVDNTHMIDNYFEMAQTARDAGNNAEAESYCNKIIEIDPTNYKAWILKGKAAAWQSTLQDSRIDEGVNAFIKGINNAPKEEKEELIEEAKEQIKSLSIAMISLRAERFSKWPDEAESTGFISDLAAIFNTVITFLTQTGALIPIAEIMAPVANKINDAVCDAYKNVIWPDYNGDPNDSDDRANKYEWQNFIERIGYCTQLVEKAISICDEDDESDIQRYENLIFLHKAAIDSCSWDYDFTSWGKSWHKDWSLTNEAKNARRTMINQYETKIKEIKAAIAAKEVAEKAEKERIAREEAQKRFAEYWEEHVTEKVALESEKEELNSQIAALNTSLNDQLASLNKEIAGIPGKAEIDNIDVRIKKLTDEKSSLGIFKGKEKNALQEQIDKANTEKKAVQSRMEAAKKEIESKVSVVKSDFQKKLSPLQSRFDEISNELTKPR